MKQKNKFFSRIVHESLTMYPAIYMGQFLLVLGFMRMADGGYAADVAKILTSLYIALGGVTLLACTVRAYLRVSKSNPPSR